MVCDFLNRDSGLRIISRPVARFLDLTVCRAMGCFFHCFGVRTDRSRPHLVISCSKSTERTVSRNRLSSLFVDEGKKNLKSSERGEEKSLLGSGLRQAKLLSSGCTRLRATRVAVHGGWKVKSLHFSRRITGADDGALAHRLRCEMRGR
ncbi:protein JASON-like isoform X2 [Gossypium arboreum]|uniref:protein JASON-like isoform X2 n=1 Tax=Gossypium arboreum TaxID=29729 RepID=UPI0008191502|nr:protein JASON-like isoform X2 [Gossypium arboreum]